MSTTIFIVFFRIFTISLLFLISVLVLRSDHRKVESDLTVFFCLGVIGYLLVDWDPMQGYWLFYFLLPFAFALPFVFWLLSKSLFDDTFSFKPWMMYLLVLIIVLSYTLHFLNFEKIVSIPESAGIILNLIQHSLSLVFVILAINEAVVGRATDLIISRLRFRNLFIFLSAILIGTTTVVEIAFHKGGTPTYLNLIQKGFIAGLTFYFAVQRLVFKPGFFKIVEKTAPNGDKVKVDEKLVAELMQLMDVQKIYHTEGLSIRQLAAKMEVQEYKLRQTINQHLGFKNFNEFLNAYRIQEACDILVDPNKQDLTILEIAYDLGYKSLAPFNKAFKATTGMTPTEWRKVKIIG